MCNIIKEEIVQSDMIKEECVKSVIIQEESVKIDGNTTSLLIELDTIFNRIAVTALIGPDTVFSRMGSVFAKRAEYFIF